MHCFFLRLTYTLKQPDGFHFITSGRNSKQLMERGLQGFAARRYPIRLMRHTPVTKYL